jgi:hypothetical protein
MMTTSKNDPRTRAASAFIAVCLAVGTWLAAAVPSNAASLAAPAAPTCTSGKAPVLFGGQWYCPGYVIGVKRGAYGVGTRVVLQSVTVLSVAATTITVSGGPSCLTPQTICGATIPTVEISVAALSSRPASGDIIDAYGKTSSNTMSVTGYVFKGKSSCSPDFC